jgi:hypothetical protein
MVPLRYRFQPLAAVFDSGRDGNSSLAVGADPLLTPLGLLRLRVAVRGAPGYCPRGQPQEFPDSIFIEGVKTGVRMKNGALGLVFIDSLERRRHNIRLQSA